MSQRSEKVCAMIKREASDIIHNELNDPRIGFVTIMNVEVTDDLRFARIYFSVLGSANDEKKTEEALESSKGYIKKLLGNRLGLRFVPDIAFKIDHSSEYSINIEKALSDIEPGNSEGGDTGKKPGKAGKKEQSGS